MKAESSSSSRVTVLRHRLQMAELAVVEVVEVVVVVVLVVMQCPTSSSSSSSPVICFQFGY